MPAERQWIHWCVLSRRPDLRDFKLDARGKPCLYCLSCLDVLAVLLKACATQGTWCSANSTPAPVPITSFDCQFLTPKTYNCMEKFNAKGKYPTASACNVGCVAPTPVPSYPYLFRIPSGPTAYGTTQKKTSRRYQTNGGLTRVS
jgi:hypothetical protein